jgi:predicted RNA binding protein with dsRBD fold (UPF0201 family)
MSSFQFYLEKLYASEDFQNFIEENKDAYLCSCFFVIDFEKKDNKQHFDYFIPTTKKMFSFKIESGCERVPVENFYTQGCTPKNIENDIFTKGTKIPEGISDNHNFSFEEIEKLIFDKMEKENIKSKVQNILLSLQKVNGGEFLFGTVFISALGMIKIQIDLKNMDIIEFEKKSFLDMFKIIKKNN